MHYPAGHLGSHPNRLTVAFRWLVCVLVLLPLLLSGIPAVAITASHCPEHPTENIPGRAPASEDDLDETTPLNLANSQRQRARRDRQRRYTVAVATALHAAHPAVSLSRHASSSCVTTSTEHANRFGLGTALRL